jgi:hypothetical protein
MLAILTAALSAPLDGADISPQPVMPRRRAENPVVDILRKDRSVAIWRGSATGAVDRPRMREERLKTIDTAVKKMFAKVPPKR